MDSESDLEYDDQEENNSDDEAGRGRGPKVLTPSPVGMAPYKSTPVAVEIEDVFSSLSTVDDDENKENIADLEDIPTANLDGFSSTESGLALKSENDTDNTSTTASASGSGSNIIANDEDLTSEAKRSINALLRSDRNEVRQAANQDMKKRFDFLIQQTEIFSHFMRPSIAKAHGKSEKTVEDADGVSVKDSEKSGRKRTGVSKLQQNFYSAGAGSSMKSVEQKKITQFESTPPYMQNGTLRDYQVQGLNWMISLHENGINGILADEMGLGKTIQAISLLGYLIHHKENDMKGYRHLVVVPKSTISNWMKEFKKWCPDIFVILLLGHKDDRKKFIDSVMFRRKWTVCVTTYDMVMIEAKVLRKFGYGYIIVDEGHRLKNENAQLPHVLRSLSSQHRLLLTGTPIHNNCHELWALLNFILPDVFTSSEDFDSWFNTECIEDKTMAERLHAVLRPFWLRRVKSEVEKNIPDKIEYKVFVELTPFQLEWYRKTLLKELHQYIQANGPLPATARLNSMLMNLRKVCNHPYLFRGAEPLPYVNGPHIIENSAKMVVLDKLLVKLMARGSKILIFTQFPTMMDLMEDYLWLKNWEFFRLDGNTPHEDRQQSIEEFNSPESKIQLFLLSTRAGGLGINLTSADTVIIYDSDWNPQMDIQAIDRCHRIGQTKTVEVYRLIVQDTLDERIVERAEAKRQLDHIVIQQGRHFDSEFNPPKRETIVQMIEADIAKLDQMKAGSGNEDIENILKTSKKRAEQLEQVAEKESLETLNKLGLLDGELSVRLSKVTEQIASEKVAKGFAPSNLTNFKGQDFLAIRREEKRKKLEQEILPTRCRERSTNKRKYYNGYNFEDSESSELDPTSKPKSKKRKTKLNPKIVDDDLDVDFASSDVETIE